MPTYVIKRYVNEDFRYLGCVGKFYPWQPWEVIELINKKSRNKGCFYIVEIDQKGDWIIYCYTNGVGLRRYYYSITKYDIIEVAKVLKILLETLRNEVGKKIEI